MKRKLFVICLISLVVALTAHAHDLFLNSTVIFSSRMAKRRCDCLTALFARVKLRWRASE